MNPCQQDQQFNVNPSQKPYPSPRMATYSAILILTCSQDHSGVVGYEASSSAVATAAGKAAVAELRQLFPLLLADGSLAALEDDRKEPVYFPMDLPTMPGMGLHQASLVCTFKDLHVHASVVPCMHLQGFSTCACIRCPLYATPRLALHVHASVVSCMHPQGLLRMCMYAPLSLVCTI